MWKLLEREKQFYRFPKTPILRELSLFHLPGSFLENVLIEFVFIWSDSELANCKSLLPGAFAKNNLWQLFKIAAAWGDVTVEVNEKLTKNLRAKAMEPDVHEGFEKLKNIFGNLEGYFPVQGYMNA